VLRVRIAPFAGMTRIRFERSRASRPPLSPPVDSRAWANLADATHFDTRLASRRPAGPTERHCCVVRSCEAMGRGDGVWSDRGGEFVVASSDVLYEGVAANDDDACGAVGLESAHRPQPRFQPSVVAFDPVVGVLRGVVHRRRCCVVRSRGAVNRRDAVQSGGRCEFVERGSDTKLIVSRFGAEFVVASSQVLDEGVAADDDARGPVGLESAHRS
jgi:hypothetical protein